MEQASASLFNLAESRLAWISHRQTLLAQNIANADTPGWKVHDVHPFTAAVDALAISVLRTAPSHLSGTAGTASDMIARTQGRSPDGNMVSIEREMQKVADGDTNHDLVMQLYKKFQGLFRTALGR